MNRQTSLAKLIHARIRMLTVCLYRFAEPGKSILCLARRRACGHYVPMPQKSAKAAAHLATGAEGEEEAAAFLRAGGLRIVERNWRSGHLELDIIAADGPTLVFVEVKSRTEAPGSAFQPLDAFNKAKRKRVMKAATLYLEQKKAWESPCRFDLVCIIFKPDASVSLEHHQNVLSFESQGRGTLGGGNAPWQPW